MKAIILLLFLTPWASAKLEKIESHVNEGSVQLISGFATINIEVNLTEYLELINNFEENVNISNEKCYKIDGFLWKIMNQLESPTYQLPNSLDCDKFFYQSLREIDEIKYLLAMLHKIIKPKRANKQAADSVVNMFKFLFGTATEADMKYYNDIVRILDESEMIDNSIKKITENRHEKINVINANNKQMFNVINQTFENITKQMDRLPHNNLLYSLNIDGYRSIYSLSIYRKFRVYNAYMQEVLNKVTHELTNFKFEVHKLISNYNFVETQRAHLNFLNSTKFLEDLKEIKKNLKEGQDFPAELNEGNFSTLWNLTYWNVFPKQNLLIFEGKIPLVLNLYVHPLPKITHSGSVVKVSPKKDYYIFSEETFIYASIENLKYCKAINADDKNRICLVNEVDTIANHLGKKYRQFIKKN